MNTRLKKIKIIYNPNSGSGSFKYSLDPVIEQLQEGGFEVSVFRPSAAIDIEQHINQIADEYDTIVASGGDGSIGIVVNAIMKRSLAGGYKTIPKLGIIPSGTSNDYAAFLQIPQDPQKAAGIISAGNTVYTDIGKVTDYNNQTANETYFINVCAAGHFMDISYSIETEVKNLLGKLAYYLKVVEQAPRFAPIPLRITNSTDVYEGDFYFFTALNTSGAGGFNKIADKAVISDGLLDFVAVREGNLSEIAAGILSVIKGEHLSNPLILYFQDNYIKIEHTKELPSKLIETNVDGERGCLLPIEITNIKEAIEIYV